MTAVEFKTLPKNLEAVVGTVTSHSSDDQYHPVLLTISVEFDGDSMTLAATDRYTLAVYRADLRQLSGDKEFSADPLTRSFYAHDFKRLFAFAKAGKPGPATWLFSGEGLTVELADGATLTVGAVDVTFVSYRKILADQAARPKEVTANLSFDGRRLASFNTSTNAVNKVERQSHAMAIWPGETATKPVMVTVGKRFLGLLMPIRPADDLALDVAPFIAPATKEVAA